MTSVSAAAPAAPPLPTSPAGDAMPSQAPAYPPASPLALTPEVVSRSHLAVADRQRLATAVVYCEANFGGIDGKCGFHGNPATHSTAIRPVIPGVSGHP